MVYRSQFFSEFSMNTTPKELLFSGGAGALSYELGYAQALLEIVGRHKLKEYILGGVSSGAACAGFLYNSIYSENDLRFWFLESCRRIYESPNKKFFGLITTSDLIYDLSKQYYSSCKEKGVPDFKGKFHCAVAVLENFAIQKEIIDEFQDAEDFAGAIKASCFLPGLGGLKLYMKYRGKKVLDGGAACTIPYKYENSEKIFINILPNRWPFVREKPPNTTILNISEFHNLNFPLDYWLWKDTWADEMFLKGYLAGIKTQEEIKKVFQIQ